MRFDRNRLEQQIRFVSIIAFAVALLFVWHPRARAQQDDMKGMPGMDMQHSDAEQSPAVLAKQASDKKESEFNHHLAGLLVALAGVFLLTQDKLAKRWPAARFGLSWCFLVAGLFLLVFSDTDIWPFGSHMFLFALIHNSEELQPKA